MMTLSLAQTKMTLVATSQGVMLVNCHFTAERDLIHPSILLHVASFVIQ